jgi:hypothetical protein
MTEDTLVAHLRETLHALNDRVCARDQREAFHRIVATGVAAVPGAHAAGLTLLDDRCFPALQTIGPPVVGPLDALQRQGPGGPVQTLLAETPADGVLVVDDLSGPDGERWPHFTAQALRAGVRSMITVLLEVEGAPCTTLNIYGARPAAFDAGARRCAGLVAIDAGVLLLGAKHVEQMARALDSRDVIGRAKGVLMERFGLDQDAAFTRLVDASQSTNLKLVEVARWIDDECATAVRAPRPGPGAGGQGEHDEPRAPDVPRSRAPGDVPSSVLTD